MEYRVTEAVEPADVLRAVADEIERVGWHQATRWQYGNVDPLTGAVCLYGGLDAVLVGVPSDAAAWDDPRYKPSLALLEERVTERSGGVHGVSEWNDYPGRELEEVLGLLRGEPRLND